VRLLCAFSCRSNIHIDPNLPTVLVYGHDVQPPDPIELWTSPPFEPVIKKTEIHPEGAIFARGAVMTKAKMYMHVKAFEYMIANDCLPCNVKFMIEGEVGSKVCWFGRKKPRKIGKRRYFNFRYRNDFNDQPSITTGFSAG
jgi:acetylornithine deacetylase/succinyl-diaminopimelate desuccinylase-like protein